MLLLMRPPCMLSNIFVRVPGLQAPINVVFILALFWLFGMEACFLHRTSKRMASFCFVERTVKRRRICNERRFLFTVRYRGASRSHAKAQGSFFYSHFSIVYRFKRKWHNYRQRERWQRQGCPWIWMWVWKMFFRKSFSIVFPNPQTTNSNGEPISRRMGRWLRHRLSKHGRSFFYHGLQGIFNYTIDLAGAASRFGSLCLASGCTYIYMSLIVLDSSSLTSGPWSLTLGPWLLVGGSMILESGSLTLGPVAAGHWLLVLGSCS